MIIKKPFGKTGMAIPPIIFGTSALGNLYQALDYETKKTIVSECLLHVSAPVVFDSAGKYGAGLALETLGNIFNDLSVAPENIIISNKLGWKRIPLKTSEPTFEKGIWKDLKFDAIQQISYDGIIECFEQGNELLGGKYLPQLISVHDPDEYVEMAKNEKEKDHLFQQIIEAYKALQKLKSDGKAKFIGVGAKNWKIIQQIEAETELDWVMFANSMTIMRHPPELVDFMNYLISKGVGIINSAVFHAGFLIGGDFFDYRLIKPDSKENKEIFTWRENFLKICNQFSINPADACVQFGMSAPGVAAISLNTSNPRRVKSNVESFNVHIPDEFWINMKQNGLISHEYTYI